MFTGLVEALGQVTEVTPDGAGGNNLRIQSEEIFSDVALGASIAINGTCLTVVESANHQALFQAGPETLLKTNLGELTAGDRVNLERSLSLGDRMGGHMVLGHVDGVGQVASREKQGDWEVIWFTCSNDLAAQMVGKGSVAVDGISLTVVDVKADAFSVALIPHTLAVTTLGWKQVGAKVNLETDVLAKYVWKYMEVAQPKNSGTQ